MRILAISDEPSQRLWGDLCREALSGVDLILSAGDLPAKYLSFLTCFTDAPILYVHGNHDKGYDRKPPEGCTCVDDDICVVNGVRVLGLGGSMRYRPGEPYMHTERQMARRARKLWWKLHRNKGFDILLAHAPAKGIGDLEDLPHRGFETFLTLMDRWRPRYLVYGHVHQEYGAMKFERERRYGETTCVNAYKRYVIEF